MIKGLAIGLLLMGCSGAGFSSDKTGTAADGGTAGSAGSAGQEVTGDGAGGDPVQADSGAVGTGGSGGAGGTGPAAGAGGDTGTTSSAGAPGAGGAGPTGGTGSTGGAGSGGTAGVGGTSPSAGGAAGTGMDAGDAAPIQCPGGAAEGATRCKTTNSTTYLDVETCTAGIWVSSWCGGSADAAYTHNWSCYNDSCSCVPGTCATGTCGGLCMWDACVAADGSRRNGIWCDSTGHWQRSSLCPDSGGLCPP